jgi:hypothetical protein
MSQLDLFGDPEPPITAEPDPKEQDSEQHRHAAAIAALPEKLRPSCAPALPVPTGKAELEEWTRVTQRIYLLYLVGAIARVTYRESSIANARYVLMKLNGLGGQW